MWRVILTLLCFTCLSEGAVLRVGTYNVENYVSADSQNRPPKQLESKQKVQESIIALRADVLALQEMGSPGMLEQLRSDLKKAGLEYRYSDFVQGWDTNIAVALLSRYPFARKNHHTNETFLLYGRRFHMNRAIAEVQINLDDGYSFTLLATHLKSRRESMAGDQAAIRQEEAARLRLRIDQLLKSNPTLNLVVLGDFNDHKGAPAIRTILGQGPTALVDTRPSEPHGDPSNRPIVWTHFYALEETYSRVDYIFLSKGMAKEWLKQETEVLRIPGWGLASDHRPIVAGFTTSER